MLKLLIKPEALKDLEKIYEFTFDTWGIDQADKYQNELFHGMNLLQENIELGKAYPYSKYEYRILPINRHLIFYRKEENTCIVVRILHDRMDVKRHLK